MCDCLVALGPVTADGTTLFAKNSDRPTDEQQHVLRAASRVDVAPIRCTYVDVAPHDAPTFAFAAIQPTWMWGVEGGVNAKSVAIGNEMIFTTLDPRPFPPALTGMDVVRLGLSAQSPLGEGCTATFEELSRTSAAPMRHRQPPSSSITSPNWSKSRYSTSGQATCTTPDSPRCSCVRHARLAILIC